MLKKYIKAQITIMAALSITLVLSLILTCIRSVSDNMRNTYIKSACMLAMEGAFSCYHNDMLDEYDILVMKKTDVIKRHTEDYIRQNTDMGSKGIELTGVEFNDFGYITSDGGYYLTKEIAAYMKYGVYSEVIDMFKNTQEQVEKAEKINEIASDISKCEEELWNIDEKILQLIQLVDGVKTNDTGLVIKSGKPEAVTDGFAKMAVNGEVSMISVGVGDSRIYDSVKNSAVSYVNVYKILQDMIDDVDGLYEIGDEESELSGNNSYAALYSRNYDALSKALEESREKTKEALNVLDEYESAKTGVDDSISECIDKIKSNREILGEELYKGMMSDIEYMQTTETSSKKSMCDTEILKQALQRNEVILDGVYKVLKELDVKLLQADCKSVRPKVIRCRKLLSGLSVKGLEFDYSGIDFTSKGNGLSAVKKIKQLITDGILALVVNTDEISSKVINYSDLASTITDKYENNDSAFNKTADALLMNEYLMTKFNSYTDYLDEDSNENDCLDYTLEYIIGGENSDKDNLEQVMLKLSGIRTGINLAYLITDQSKKAEAYSLAATALGFTGNMAIIKAGQYLVLSVWAYAEAVVDLRKLYSGEKIELVKTKDTWNLSLENLLSMNFDVDNDNNNSGIDYEGYIRMLLVMESMENKNYRTMGAMELKMISLGHSDFRMRDYIVSAQARAFFKCTGRQKIYKQYMKCSYI